MGQAYAQFGKNAWQVDDRAAVERNLRLSVDATQRALALDPDNDVARKALALREGRLKDLVKTQ